MLHHGPRTLLGLGTALLILVGCSGDDPAPPEPQQPTAGPHETEQPTDVPSPPPTPEATPTSPTSEPTPTLTDEASPEPGTPEGAPERGAIVTVGGQQVSISTALCHRIDGVWTMSAGEEDEVKAAVRSAVGNENVIDSVSVIFPDGYLAQIHPGTGEATIEHDGNSFILTGMAEGVDVTDPDSSPTAAPLTIAATCQY